ncbi:MAG: Txe/YoeB family addiction module toxin [Oscillospiraceae bacterium]|nr:Txe/YoeB family addiction module toxin [Oscillospiraceae bacterium]
MNNITFAPAAWDDYLYWQTQDKKTLRRINQLLRDIQRSNFEGVGKPEPMKQRGDCWSRRIDDKNRLVYYIQGEKDIMIMSCRGHYED